MDFCEIQMTIYPSEIPISDIYSRISKWMTSNYRGDYYYSVYENENAMDLLPDMQDCALRMRWECRKRFPRHRLQRKPLLSDPGMHHGTHVTHVPRCMSGSSTAGDVFWFFYICVLYISPQCVVNYPLYTS